MVYQQGLDEQETVENEGLEVNDHSKYSWLDDLLSFVLTFILMFVLWIVLSGKFEVLFLVLGVGASFLVALFSRDLLFPSPHISKQIVISLRFLKYVPWILYQVFLANIHLLYLVFHPKMSDLIDPRIITFQSTLKKELAIVTMANSITATPGTITISATIDGDFKVHAIDEFSAKDLPDEMQQRVSKTFGEVQ
ncbi:MAG TPA: Na+/H+ antiporter subunit E [Desulfohalobiaceae bacterium]|nr:Na+/H+ antiporter subunit E [Desulfohalobiaceae bacterium]